jgi:5'-3' exonuclease
MLLIADGNNLAWAGFHALRKPMAAETPELKIRATLLGLAQTVIGMIVRAGEPPPEAGMRPAPPRPGQVRRVAVVFDEGRPLRRRGIFPGYQMGREATASFTENEPFVLEGIRLFSEAAAVLPIEVIRGVNAEADDLIASLALNGHSGPLRIASSDRDFLQLVDERLSIYSPQKRLVIGPDNFTEATAPTDSDGRAVPFPRERYLDYRAASGDASDDLPGIPAVGTLTAARLLAHGPMDQYFAKPGLITGVLGRRNIKLEGALYSGEARTVFERNHMLMDLRLGAAHYPSLDEMTSRGTWDAAAFRAWCAEQRIAGLDVNAACEAFESIASS